MYTIGTLYTFVRKQYQARSLMIEDTIQCTCTRS